MSRSDVLRIALPIIMGSVIVGSAFASVPSEDRRRDWPAMAGALGITGLALIVYFRKHAGLPILPGKSAVPDPIPAPVTLHLVKEAA